MSNETSDGNLPSARHYFTRKRAPPVPDNNNKQGAKHVATIPKPSSAVKLFSCDHCSLITDRKSTLTRHKKNIKTKPANLHLRAPNDTMKRFACDHCGYISNHKNLLKSHIKHIHSAYTKRYTCAVCKYATLLHHCWKAHVVKCPAKDDFQCKECGFISKSNRKDALARHLLTHSSSKCDQCDYSTTRKSSLALHKIRHHELKCNTCGLFASTKSILNDHFKSVHTFE